MAKRVTTAEGIPVGSNLNAQTAGQNGPMLIQDFHFLDKMAHFGRERTPEREVHAKGWGAHGKFTVTKDVTKWTKAKFLNEVGKETPVFLRFSSVAGELGRSDTERDPRGFALKFYTEEGNYDMTGNNTPAFFIRDPMIFPEFIHAVKRDPVTHLRSATMFWDVISHLPESVFQTMITYSDRGIPESFRHMHGFSSHTFLLRNEKGEPVWTKLHFKTQQGIKNMDPERAKKMMGENPDFHGQDLREAIDRGEFPKWTLYFQIIPYELAKTRATELFDMTKVMKQEEFPLHEVGVLELNRNPNHYFAEVEQAAFNPGNLVPGIESSPDKMLQGRLFSYQDTHRHRIGPNFFQVPINRPIAPVHNHQESGFMYDRPLDKPADHINYFPNSFDGTWPEPESAKKDQGYNYAAEDFQGGFTVGNYAYDDNFYEHPKNLWKIFDDGQKDRFCDNVASHLAEMNDEIKGARKVQPDKVKEIQDRVIGLFLNVDPACGGGIRTKLDAYIAKK